MKVFTRFGSFLVVAAGLLAVNTAYADIGQEVRERAPETRQEERGPESDRREQGEDEIDQAGQALQEAGQNLQNSRDA